MVYVEIHNLQIKKEIKWKTPKSYNNQITTAQERENPSVLEREKYPSTSVLHKSL